MIFVKIVTFDKWIQEGEGVNFPCDQCDYKATEKRSLSRHTKSIHEGVKFPCDQCDFKSTQRGDLLRHIKSRHYTCFWKVSYHGQSEELYAAPAPIRMLNLCSNPIRNGAAYHYSYCPWQLTFQKHVIKVSSFLVTNVNMRQLRRGIYWDT